MTRYLISTAVLVILATGTTLSTSAQPAQQEQRNPDRNFELIQTMRNRAELEEFVAVRYGMVAAHAHYMMETPEECLQYVLSGKTSGRLDSNIRIGFIDPHDVSLMVAGCWNLNFTIDEWSEMIERSGPMTDHHGVTHDTGLVFGILKASLVDAHLIYWWLSIEESTNPIPEELTEYVAAWEVLPLTTPFIEKTTSETAMKRHPTAESYLMYGKVGYALTLRNAETILFKLSPSMADKPGEAIVNILRHLGHKKVLVNKSAIPQLRGGTDFLKVVRIDDEHNEVLMERIIPNPT